MPYSRVQNSYRWRSNRRLAAVRSGLSSGTLAGILIYGLVSVFLSGMLGLRTVEAASWHARLVDIALPSHLVAVDKARQTFLFYERHSPLKLKFSYPCSTGQVPGDKQVLNDRRTPEGVYFVEYKIARGLDFREYGGIAYTLNYPNPVDRLRGKTGHGIWIHSKGFGISPLSTRGCVAIDLKDLDEVGPSLVPGTAVVLAEHLDAVPLADAAVGTTALELRRLMQDWSKAWADRSPQFFEYYDEAAYTRAMSEPFAAFRQNKERLFSMLQFIKIYNRKIHVLPGPGYWVTWAEQLYTASNVSTEGIRRLYWQQGEDKRFRIVGMEWTPRDVGLQAAYLKGQLVAEATLPTASDAASEVARPPRLDMPETPNEPVTASVNVASGMDNANVATSVAAVADPRMAGRTATPAPEVAQQGGQAQPLPTTVTPELRAAVTSALAQWQKAFAARSPEIFSLYDTQNYHSLRGGPRGPVFAHTKRRLETRFKSPWLRCLSRQPRLAILNGCVMSWSDMLVVSPRGMEQGVLSLWWNRGNDGAWRIVGSQFRPKELGFTAEWLESVSDEIFSMLEQWRTAWEGARLDDYMAFYTADALQQGRRGERTIRQQKEILWQRARPANVRLTGLRLMPDPRGIRADMNQAYTDASGHTDRGVKTLWLHFDGTSWHIAREDWTPPHAALPAGDPRRVIPPQRQAGIPLPATGVAPRRVAPTAPPAGQRRPAMSVPVAPRPVAPRPLAPAPADSDGTR